MTTPDQGSLTTSTGEPLPYAEALSELEAILLRLESADVDVDSLARQVERATVLISYCRARLATVEQNVAAVLNSSPPVETQTEDRLDPRP